MAVKSKTFNLKNHFVGLPREEDFEVVEKTLPPIADGGKWNSTKIISDLIHVMTAADCGGLKSAI